MYECAIEGILFQLFELCLIDRNSIPNGATDRLFTVPWIAH